MHHRKGEFTDELIVEEWMQVVDEIATHQIPSLLLRGGEPFLFPGIIELLTYIRSKGIHISIDTNGTMLERFAEAIVDLGGIHLTISVDGPERIHDHIRGVNGTFDRLRRGVLRIHELERDHKEKISKSVNFTICKESLSGLGEMPEVTRSLGIDVIAIVPYYYFPESLGKTYESEMLLHFGCPAFSWRGFHHEESGVDFNEFHSQLELYRANLGGLFDYPYMAFSYNDYANWFKDAHTSVYSTECSNVEKLIDIQPNGNVNFCVDFPDYVIGNVRQATIEEIWNSDRAEHFRTVRREIPLSICHRCGAKYMSEI